MGDEAARRGDGSDRGEGGGSGSQRRKRPKKVGAGWRGAPPAPPGVRGGELGKERLLGSGCCRRGGAGLLGAPRGAQWGHLLLAAILR